MQRINAVLIDLDGTLFKRATDHPLSLLQVYQPINFEVLELLTDLQRYSFLIAFYPICPRAEYAFKQRLLLENLTVEKLIISPIEKYDDVKLDSYYLLSQKYRIVNYIDEKEDSPWSNLDSVHRLHL